MFNLIRTSLADPLIFVGLMVFLAGFRHLIRQARQEDEWPATLVFASVSWRSRWSSSVTGSKQVRVDNVAKARPTVVRRLDGSGASRCMAQSG